MDLQADIRSLQARWAARDRLWQERQELLERLNVNFREGRHLNAQPPLPEIIEEEGWDPIDAGECSQEG